MQSFLFYTGGFAHSRNESGNIPKVDSVLQIVHGLVALGVDLADTPPEENHGATRTTKGLVRGGGDNVGVLKRALDAAGSDQARNVGHIDDQVGADRVGNLAHALVVNLTAVRRGTGDERLGPVEDGRLGQHVVIDDSSFLVDTIGHGLKVGGNCRDPGADISKQLRSPKWKGNELLLGGLVSVGQMAAMGQVQAHQAVMGLHDGLVHLQVCW